jgi:hypothetical protein
MGETNSPSVAHVGYDISPLSWVEKYHNPRPTKGESIYIYIVYSGTCAIRHLRFPTSCDFRQEFQVPKYFFNILC